MNRRVLLVTPYFPPVTASGAKRPLHLVRNLPEFGWEPERSVEDVIRETIDWLRKNLDRLKSVPADYVHKP